MDWARVPLFLYLTAVCAAAMLPAAMLAAIDGEPGVALAFVTCAVVTSALCLIIAMSLNNRPPSAVVRSGLLALLGAVTVLPWVLSWPLLWAVPELTWLDGYVEMVSAVTTTGLPVADDSAWPRAAHLWRVVVAWLGGFLIWTAAVAILAPVNIGGAELTALRPQDLRRDSGLSGGRTIYLTERMVRAVEDLVWVYGGLTFALWLLLLFAGEAPFVAFCHAMSTLATSGLSPVGGIDGGSAGFAGEAAVMVFLVFALTRRSFARDLPGIGPGGLIADPELRAAAVLIGLVTVVLFVRHWVALVETAELIGLSVIARAVWGAVFTAASFLTTAGFISEQWEIARLWSGLSTPGLVLMGLAIVGGGVATTAGGVKLLRIYVLYKHGQREVSRLVHPSTVGGIGTRDRPMRQETAHMAWLTFMLVALSITLTMLALSLTGLDFETATVLTIAAISTAGPLTEVASAAPIDVGSLPAGAKLILCGAMALGRLETLAIIALLSPGLWDR